MNLLYIISISYIWKKKVMKIKWHAQGEVGIPTWVCATLSPHSQRLRSTALPGLGFLICEKVNNTHPGRVVRVGQNAREVFNTVPGTQELHRVAINAM